LQHFRNTWDDLLNTQSRLTTSSDVPQPHTAQAAPVIVAQHRYRKRYTQTGNSKGEPNSKIIAAMTSVPSAPLETKLLNIPAKPDRTEMPPMISNTVASEAGTTASAMGTRCPVAAYIYAILVHN